MTAVTVVFWFYVNWPAPLPHVIRGEVRKLANQSIEPKNPGDKPLFLQHAVPDRTYYGDQTTYQDGPDQRDDRWTLVDETELANIRIRFQQLYIELPPSQSAILRAGEVALSLPPSHGEQPVIPKKGAIPLDPQPIYVIRIKGIAWRHSQPFHFEYVLDDDDPYHKPGKLKVFSPDEQVIQLVTAEEASKPSKLADSSRRFLPPWKAVLAFAQSQPSFFDANGKYDAQFGRGLRRDLASSDFRTRQGASKLLIDAGTRSLRFISDTLAVQGEGGPDRSRLLHELGNVLEGVAGKSPVPDLLYLTLATELYKMGDFPAAEVSFESVSDKALRADPSNLFYFGVAAQQAGKLDKAAASYEEYLKVPDAAGAARALALNNLGLARLKQGQQMESTAKYGEAVRLYDEAVKQFTSATKLSVSGSSAATVKNLKGAVEARDKAARLIRETGSPAVASSGTQNRNATVELTLVDVYGELIQTDRFDVFFTSQDTKQTPSFRKLPGNVKITIPPNVYRMEVDSEWHRSVSRFVTAEEGKSVGLRVTVPVDPAKVSYVDFPSYKELPAELRAVLEDSKVLGFEGWKGDTLYAKFDDIRRAGLLNLTAKMLRTRLPSEHSVFSYLQTLDEVRGDVIFGKVDPQLYVEVAQGVSYGLFKAVSSVLDQPPPGYSSLGKYETWDRYPNLKLTFFKNGDSTLVYARIDESSGLAHVFQISHTLGPTHPYDIHELLIGQQEINPGYRLIHKE